MTVEPFEFRRILGHWTTGVTIIATTTAAGEPRGLTANAFASVSLEPPLVLACVERDADSHEPIRAAGFFSISVLSQDDERLARRFAGNDTADKFVGVAYHGETTGAPILDSALAWLDCTVEQIVDAGDHTIFVGRVLAGDAMEGEPLIYYRGGYGRLTP